jgi:hypothetical protein
MARNRTWHHQPHACRQVLPGPRSDRQADLLRLGAAFIDANLGIVDDIKEGPLEDPNSPALYVPVNQNPLVWPAILVRTSQPQALLSPKALLLGVVGTAIGVILGALGSLGMATQIRPMLFGVCSWDPPTLLGVAAVLGVSALLASYALAHRAVSVNPVEALSTE